MNADTLESIIKVIGAPAIVFVFLTHLLRVKNGSKGRTRFEKLYVAEKQDGVFEQIIYFFLIIWVNYTVIYDYDFSLHNNMEFNLMFLLSSIYYVCVYLYFVNILFKINGWYYRIVNNQKQYYISINPLIKVVYLSESKTVNHEKVITDTIDKDTEYVKYFEKDNNSNNFLNLKDNNIKWKLSYIIYGFIIVISSALFILLGFLFLYDSHGRSGGIIIVSFIILIIGFLEIYYTIMKYFKSTKQNKAPTQQSE